MRMTRDRFRPGLAQAYPVDAVRRRRAAPPALDLDAALKGPPACGLAIGTRVRLREGARVRVELGGRPAVLAAAVADRAVLAVAAYGRLRLIDVPAAAIEAAP